jgi:hypothetical protein
VVNLTNNTSYSNPNSTQARVFDIIRDNQGSVVLGIINLALHPSFHMTRESPIDKS